MDWIANHWDGLVGIAGTVYGVVAHAVAVKRKREAKRTAAELDRIREAAGTKASWERRP